MTAATPFKISWLIGAFAAMALFAVIAVYSSSVDRHATDYDRLRAMQRKADLQTIQADAAKTLNAPADWVDQAKGTVHIPIDEAMAREIETLNSTPAGPGDALPPPPPSPSHPKPAPAAATAPPAGKTAPAAAPPPAAPAATATPAKPTH